MSIHSIAKSLYGLSGVIFIVVGIAIVSFNTGLLPASFENIILKNADNNMNALHLLQEFGALLVFAGIISIWFILNYEQSMNFHRAMTTFWALIALVHWFDVRGMRPSPVGPIINTIPVVLFAIVGIIRNRK